MTPEELGKRHLRGWPDAEGTGVLGGLCDRRHGTQLWVGQQHRRRAEEGTRVDFENFSLSGRNLSGKESDTLSLFLHLHRPVPPPTRTDVPHDGCVEGGNAGDGGGHLTVTADTRNGIPCCWKRLQLWESPALRSSPSASRWRHFSKGMTCNERHRQDLLFASPALFHASVRVLEEGSREGRSGVL